MKTQANYLDTIAVEEKYLHVRGSSSKAARADTQDKKLEINSQKILSGNMKIIR